MDESSQSTFGGSLSQNLCNTRNSQDAQGGTNPYRKNPWLIQYFKHEKSGDKSTVVCKACDKKFASRSHVRMSSHLAKCKKTIGYDPYLSERLSDPETTQSVTSTIFARQLIGAGWSLRGVETSDFKKFIARLNGQWQIPSRQEFTALYFPRMSLQLQAKFRQTLKLGGNNSVSIEFDHWQDAVGKSFLGVIATCNSGARFLLDLRDVSLRSHDAAVTVDVLQDVLKPLNKLSVNSLVSDSAANCKKARQDIVKQKDFEHVIQHRCLAHFLNLIGSRLTVKVPVIAKTVKQVSKIASILSGSSYWTAYLKELKCTRVRTACPVRWFSTCTMLTALLDLKTVILEEILPNLDREKADLIRGLNWQHASEILELVEPLSECIGQVERRDTSLGEGLKCILDYARKLFSEESDAACSASTTSNSNNVRVEMRKAFLHYFNKKYLGTEELELWLAAYALDRRYKLDFITTKGIELCLRAISRVAIQTGVTLEIVKSTIFAEFEHYKNFKGIYAMTSSSPTEWWNERTSCGILSRVGQRLAHLKASSANIERTFSAMKWIQGEYRLSMSAETLLHMARIKISMKDESLDKQSCWHEEWIEESILVPPTVEAEVELIESSLENCSFSSDGSSSITIECDSSNWLEYQDTETKMNFQSFFKYFDFSIINESQSSPEVLDRVTDEEIKNCVRESIRARIYPAESIITDSYSQIQELDAMSVDL